MKPPDYIFCGTAWPIMPVQNYVLWAKYNSNLFPDSKLVIINDGPDAKCWTEDTATIVNLEPHLGRPSHYNHAGCFRSIFHMQNYFDKATKVMWIDWDFYIISQRFLDWLCDITKGWRGVWCPQFGFPETSMMVVCRNQFGQFNEFAGGWDAVPKLDEFERHVPFTEVNRDFIGGRYADVGEQPPSYADYIAQVNLPMAEIIVKEIE